MKKSLTIFLIVFIILGIFYLILGRQIPIHPSTFKVGSERIFYQQTSRLIQCDVAYLDVVIDEDDRYEYYYELISVGNGSCVSELYIWHEFKAYTLDDAMSNDIVSLDDFLESTLAKKRIKN